MGQSAIKRVYGIAKPAAYWETIRERLDVSLAANVVMNYLKGDESIPLARANLAWKVVEKQLPSLQAIAVEVTHKTADSMESLQDRAAKLGLSSDALFAQVIDTTEKIDSVQDVIEAAPTRELDE